MVRTDNRNLASQTRNEQDVAPAPLTPQQPLFVGLPGALAGVPVQGFTTYGVGAPLGYAPAPYPAIGVQGYAPQGIVSVVPAQGSAFIQGFPTFSPVQGFAAFAGSSAPVGALPVQAFQATQPPGIAQPSASIPAAVQDLGREIVATFEVPGVTAQDLHVVVGNTSIALRTERPAANGRAYQGIFQLPAEVLPSQASARLEHGLLVLTLPRRTPTEEPRRVSIEG
jgi:HSP20 family molecular chaperone IbpA